MKKTFLFFVAVMMAVCVKAQVLQVAPQGLVSQSSVSKNYKKTISPKEGQMWWGYFSGSEKVQYLGTGYAETFDCAIFVPGNHDLVGSNTINALRFYIPTPSNVSMLKVWISEDLPTDIDNADYVQTIDLGTLLSGINDISLNTPYDVNDKAIYVGYSFTIKSAEYCIGFGGDYVDNSLFLRSSWSVSQWEQVTNGKLALQLLLDGGVYPSNCARASDFGRTVSFIDQSSNVSVPVTVTNTGQGTVSEITYTLTTDGGTPTEETTVNVGTLAYNESKTFSVNLSGDEARKYENVITITKVNGVRNNTKQKTATGYLIVTSEKPTNVPVVEEFTGTWCGYCPYGIVGMKKAHDYFGDKVVLIAVHSGDVMDIWSYDEVINAYASGYPSARISRGSSSIYPDPYIIYDLNSSLKDVTQGTIELTARWADDTKTAVDFSTTSKFFYNAEGEQYGIAFVLVEDGLKGSGSQWAQRNFLSGESGSGDMSFWYSAGSVVSGLEYDHVAVAAWDVMNGVDGSVTPTIQSGVGQNFSYTGDISTNLHIQDKSKLTAVALLIDRGSGRIVNAAQTTIAESLPVKKGDANGNGEVDTEDVLAVVSYLLGDSPAGFSIRAADLTGDNKVDITDLTRLIEAVKSVK